MTQDELFVKLSAKLPHLEKAEAPVKDYLTMRLKDAGRLVETARVLKEQMGFNYLEMVSATDWLGAVNPEGYIRNPNPVIFMAEGATPQSIPTATPNFPYRPTIDLLWLFGNIEEKIRLVLRLELPRDKAVVPSLIEHFKAADWQEREIYDLLGVTFTGHPRLEKILTPDFLKGHPLRKDYVHVKDRFDE